MFFAQRWTRLMGYVGIATVVATSPVMAQSTGGSILMLLDVEGRLEIDGETTGALSASDYKDLRDSYLDAWELEGRAGQSVTIDMVADFDAYLYVVGPGQAETLSDDDTGGGCNARITFQFLENGLFRVVASSNSRATGVYTLRVSTTPPPVQAFSCGGVNPEVFENLPTDGRTLELGSVVTGMLGAGDPTVESDRPGQAWALEGRAGESVTITLESTDFDSYLYVYGPGIPDPLSDDDGAGDLNSELTVRFPTDGTYLVIASALQSFASGAYTLSVEAPLDLTTLPTANRVVRIGAPADGLLSSADPIVIDGRRGQAWELQGQAGRTVAIELISEDFDSYLYVAGPGLREPLSDDDSAGSLDSRIILTFPETGAYRVIVSALSSSSSGTFTIRVTQR